VAAVLRVHLVRAIEAIPRCLLPKVSSGKLVSSSGGPARSKPQTYVNIGAYLFGPAYTNLYVKEGHVKRGQVRPTGEGV